MYKDIQDTVKLINEICEIIKEYNNETEYEGTTGTIKDLIMLDEVSTAIELNRLIQTSDGRKIIIEKFNNTIEKTKLFRQIRTEFEQYLSYPKEICENIVKSEIRNWSVTDHNMIRHWHLYLKIKDMIRIINKM